MEHFITAFQHFNHIPLVLSLSFPSLSLYLFSISYLLTFSDTSHNICSLTLGFYDFWIEGTGGRIRDVQAVGRGGHVVAGTAGYSFGNLLLPGYDLPWESREEFYPANLASPADICIEASNGASDYGNKFGEPVIAGFCRSFGLRLPNGE